MNAPIPLSRQISAIECLQDEGDKDAIVAAVKTLRLFHRFEEEVRAKLKELLDREKLLREVQGDRAVREVLREFPGARVETGG
jgi:ribosomal 50S subunit-associated protein YjgA (DUF615 family)